MNKQYQKGGQRRTLEAPCGWRCIGHPNESNGRYAIHRRHCSKCIEINAITDLPEFNKATIKTNGWKGLLRNGNKPSKMLTTAFIDGQRQDILVDASTMEEALNDTRLTAKVIQKIMDEEKEFDSQEELEKEAVFDEICNLEKTAPFPVLSNKYSGCELQEMPIEKLKVILNIVKKQIADFNK